MSNFLKAALKSAGNQFASVLEDGLSTDSKTFIDTGSYILNALMSGSIYGGMPDNKIVCFAGEPATGKTYFALNVAASFQKQYPNGLVFYWDSEQAVSGEMLSSRGLAKERTAVMPVGTIEDFRHQCMKIVDAALEMPEAERPKMLFVLDSLGNLSSRKEITDTQEGKDTRDMTKAALIRGLFRVLTIKLGVARIPLIVNNHVYDVVGSYVPMKAVSGGAGSKYNASIIVMLSKKIEKDSEKNPLAAIIRCKLDKSRLVKEQTVVDVQLNFDSGLSKYYGLLELAEEVGVLKKSGTRLVFPNGKTAFASAVMKNPEKWFDKSLLDAIDSKCPAKFLYQSSDSKDKVQLETSEEENEE
jgi:RecA/RadA recombinase